MSRQAETRLLLEIAHQIASEDADTFQIVIVSNAYQAGLLTNILVKNLHFPKQQVTQLGYTASDEQNLSLLQKRNRVVIVPEPIAAHRPCRFYRPHGARQVLLLQLSNEQLQVKRYPCKEEPFNLNDLTAPTQEINESDGPSGKAVPEREAEASPSSQKSWWQFWK